MSEVRLMNICYVLGEGHYTIYRRGKIYTKNLNRKWLCFSIEFPLSVGWGKTKGAAYKMLMKRYAYKNPGKVSLGLEVKNNKN